MLSFSGLRTALRKFKDNGFFSKCGRWSIGKGGYDCWWEIYYDGYAVLQCIDGKLEGGFRPVSDFDDDAEKRLIEIVKSIYTDLQDNNSNSFMKLDLHMYKCTIIITDGEQVEKRDFFVESENFSEAVEEYGEYKENSDEYSSKEEYDNLIEEKKSELIEDKCIEFIDDALSELITS